jgi:hypothetical protein
MKTSLNKNIDEVSGDTSHAAHGIRNHALMRN